MCQETAGLSCAWASKAAVKVWAGLSIIRGCGCFTQIVAEFLSLQLWDHGFFLAVSYRTPLCPKGHPQVLNPSTQILEGNAQPLPGGLSHHGLYFIKRPRRVPRVSVRARKRHCVVTYNVTNQGRGTPSPCHVVLVTSKAQVLATPQGRWLPKGVNRRTGSWHPPESVSATVANFT